MSAINVARTDTFEQQRIKINQIGTELFSLTQGGSDLAAGNLKIGDGTRPSPSLGFENEPSLGIYRPENGVMGFVYKNKKLLNINSTEILNFNDVVLEKNVIAVGGIIIASGGTNYDPGTYSGISLFGGTGSNATADIEVTEFTGTVNEDGENYNPGTYQSISVSGGSGTGAAIDFDVESIIGDITNSGSGYDPSSVIFNNVPLTTLTGSGSGATANITVIGTVDIAGSITPGSGYDTDFTYTSVQLSNVPTASYTVTTVSNPGTPPPDNVYQINGVTQDTLTFNVGNTYRFDVSDASMSGHPLVFQNTDGSTLDPQLYNTINYGTPGTTGAFVDFIISPNAQLGTIKYNCSIHDGMGADVTISSGSIGNYGYNLSADVTTNSSGSVSSVVITSSGQNYKTNDVLEFSPNVVTTGSGFQYTLGAFTYNGTIQGIQVVNQGQDYETGDQLSANDVDLGGKGGSGFVYTITSNPGSISNLVFSSKGQNYQVGDLLSLPDPVRETVSFNGTVSGVSATLGATTTLSLPSTTGLVPGMTVFADPLGDGALDPTTTIQSIDSPTQITLSIAPITPGSTTLDFTSSRSSTEIEVSNSSLIVVGSTISVISGDGTVSSTATVQSVNTNTNVISLSEGVSSPGITTVDFVPPYGSTTTPLEYEIQNLGEVISISVNNSGLSYEQGDILTVNSSDLTSPIDIAVTNVSTQKIDTLENISAGTITEGDRITTDDTIFYDVLTVKNVGGSIDYIVVSGITISSGDTFSVEGNPTEYTVNTAEDGFRFLLDGDANPSITFYSGNTYRFDLSDSSNSSHTFSLSKFRDGIWGPSLIENVASSTIAGSSTVNVSSSSGILPGMAVELVSGVGILNNTFVESVVDSTTITITNSAQVSSSEIVLTFRGVEYTDGVVRTSDSLSIKVTDQTPNLYYYCAANNDSHANEGGYDNDEILITVDLNNPKTFGSGFSSVITQINTSESVKLDNVNETVFATTVNSSNIVSTSANISDSLSSGTATISDSLSTPSIDNGSDGLNITSSLVEFSADISVSDGALTVSSGNLTTSGTIKTTNYFDSNNQLRITGSTFTSLGNNDIEFILAANRIAKITGSTSLILPKGNTLQRPTGELAQNGAIRFNTQTEQYEGYNETTSSWSSLGGVRDLDGNTTILAEETPGSNDNTLWFINDGDNTIKITPDYVEFESVKRLRSLNILAPEFDEWRPNVTAVLGTYLKYKNNLYEVTVEGITATEGNEPTHTSGSLVNGESELTWYSLAVSPLIFEDIERLDIDPIGNSPLLVNSELKLQGNKVSSLINDLVIEPNSGKKVIIDATTTLVIPTGVDADRGIPSQGSIRFSTTTSQFEGFDGSNWGSLGGVKDVDQNTYIIPELSPGSNENILYFYNNNNNTLQVTTTALDFYSIDTIRSVTSDELEITASLLTFDNGTSTFDNTATDRTFLHTTKQYFDLGLSAGLTTDPVLRLDDQGDVYLNIGFGTGVYDGVKVFDGDLKEFELADVKILTEKLTLVKGTNDNGSSVIYAVASNTGAKTTIIAENPTSGDKEFIEFGILDDGTDVFHTEYGNIRTGVQLIVPTFEVTGVGNVRINISLGSGVNPTEAVNITVVSNVTKK